MKVVSIFFLFFIILIQQELNSFYVIPSSGTIVIEKKKYHTLNVMASDITKPTGIEICARKWDVDTKGDQDYSETTDDLQIFPTSFVLYPGKKQKVKVLYKGEKPLQQEKTYRLIVDEVSIADDIPLGEPIELEKTETSSVAINLTKRYVTSFFVTSKSFKDDIHASFKVFSNENEQPTLALSLKNYGLKIGKLKDYYIDVKSDNEQLKEAVKEITPPMLHVFSKHERLVEFALPELLNLQDIDPSSFSLEFR